MDVLLDVDVASELAIPETVTAGLAAACLARRFEGARFWLSPAQAPALLDACKQMLRKQNPGISPESAGEGARTALHALEGATHWLAALAEDGDGIFWQEDPATAQLQRALERLSTGAKLLTRNTRLLKNDPRAISPEAFLKIPIPKQPLPFIDLAAQQDRLRSGIERRIHRVLRHGRYILGPEIEELETALCQFTGSRHCISCASGTDALLMALMALGIGPGDAVFTTAFSFIATSEAIVLAGATPVFADIDPATYNLDPASLETVIEEVIQVKRLRPAAIMPVDLFGLPADYKRIRAIAEAHGLPIIQDAAQAFGATSEGKTVPTQGTIGCTSFFPAKPLGAYGDAGACFTDDPELASRLRSIRVHGSGPHPYEFVRLGLNARMDTLQAAILLAKLQAYPREIEQRQEIACWYDKALCSFSELTLPIVPQHYRSVFAQYTVRHPRRGRLREALSATDIPSAIYYPIAAHTTPSYAPPSVPILPETERATREVLSLPFSADLNPTVIDRVKDALRNFT